MLTCIERKRCQRGDRNEEDDRQPRKQNRKRDLIGRLLALCTFHQTNHAIEEAFAGVCGYAHDDTIGQHARAARHRASVAAGLPNDRRRFAGNRGLVDRRGAFEHVAVGGHDLSGLYDEPVTLAQARARHAFFRSVLAQQARIGIRFRAAQGLGLRFAASLRDRFGKICKEDRKPKPRRDSEIEAGRSAVAKDIPHEEDRRGSCANLDDEHYRVTGLPARIEFLERIPKSARNNRPVEEGARFGTAF